MMTKTKFPIGIQTFSEIIDLGCIYVDKTMYVYSLTQDYKYVFLSRPRRFGKSLLSSTIKSYFEGRKDLFAGLAIEGLETEWAQHPVFYFDMSTAKHRDKVNLENHLGLKLSEYEHLYGRNEEEAQPNERLEGLIKRAYAQTGRQAVVIIDEYDAPLLDVVHEEENLEALRQVMRNFYSPLKACDPYLRFTFITGITKFSQLSIFSELNNLKNISMMPEYSAICGISKTELETQLRPQVEAMALTMRRSIDETYEELRLNYDGYHFSKEGEDIFNPYSIINALNDCDINNYWFATGTPTSLIKVLQHFHTDVTTLQDIAVREMAFNAPTETMTDALPILYQSGYLTIKAYDPFTKLYTLGFPNLEVSKGLFDALFPYYVNNDPDARNGITVARLSVALRNGDVETMLQELKAFYAGIPNDLENKTEKHYQTIFYIIVTLLGEYISTEVKSAVGRADAVLKTATHIYVIEMKVDQPAEVALAQIDAKGYLIPYSCDGRKLVKVGICFDTTTRTLGEWKIVE